MTFRSDYKEVEADLEALRKTPVPRSCREAFGSSMSREDLEWEKRPVKHGEYTVSVFWVMFFLILPVILLVLTYWGIV